MSELGILLGIGELYDVVNISDLKKKLQSLQSKHDQDVVSLTQQLSSTNSDLLSRIQGLATASYIVFKDTDGLIKVKDGRTGQVVYSSSDGSDAIQYAVNQSGYGDVIYIKPGRYYLSKPITPKSGITIIGSEPFTLGQNDQFTVWVDSIGPNLGGTVLIGDDTFPAFQYTDDLVGFRVINIGLQHFTYGFKLGAPDKLIAMMVLENVYMSYIVNWGIKVYNLARSILRKVYMDGYDTYNSQGFIHIIGAHNTYVPGNCRFEELFFNGNNQAIGILIESDPNYNYSWNILTIDTYQMNSPPPKSNPNATPISYALYVKGADANHKIAQISVYSLLPEGQYDYAVRLENVEHVNIVFYRTGSVWFNNGAEYSVVISTSIVKVRNDGGPNNIVVTGYVAKSAFVAGSKSQIVFGYNPDFGAHGIMLYLPQYNQLNIIGPGGTSGDNKDFTVGRLITSSYIKYKYAGSVTVSAGSTSVTVSLPSYTPTPYYVVATPTWSTKVWVTNITNTAFTLNFDTAPSTDAPVYYIVMLPA